MLKIRKSVIKYSEITDISLVTDMILTYRKNDT